MRWLLVVAVLALAGCTSPIAPEDSPQAVIPAPPNDCGHDAQGRTWCY